MIRTRVGYSGGTTPMPTYHDLGDHSESFQVDFDPQRISYRQLLQIFWGSHEPSQRAWSRQYRPAVFALDERQQRLAQASRDALQEDLGGPVYTEILPAGPFYLAEDYHQKHRLRHSPDFIAELEVYYPDPARLLDSTVAARLNGYLSGYGDPDTLRDELGRMGLSERLGQKLLSISPRFHPGYEIRAGQSCRMSQSKG